MEKIWLKNYPKGVPAEIDAYSFSSLIDLFDYATKKYRRKPALACMGSVMSYAQLDKKSKQLAAYFQNKLGLKKGERIGIMLPNSMQYIVGLLGALRAGLTVVNINPMYTSRELEYQLNDSGVGTIVVLANLVDIVEEALPKTQVTNVILTEIGDMFFGLKASLINFAVRRIKKMVPKHNIPHVISFKDAVRNGARYKLQNVLIRGEDLAFLQYTGGTTGVSKGAMISHRNMVANVEQVYAWLDPVITPGNEVVITALPLYHIFSLMVNAFLLMKAGVKNVLIVNAKDIAGLTREMAKHKFTVFPGVNTLFKAMMRHKNFEKINFDSLKLALGGGMAVHRSVAEKWESLTGKPLLEGYGLTEASPVVCVTPLNADSYTGSIGLPMPSTEIKVADEEGNELGIGDAGELWVRGPQVMKGYWNKPRETANVLTEDGWLKTGDVVKVEKDGQIYIVDRKKDMIVVSGYNVYPTEIESVLATHPDILEVAVIGVPSEKTGEYIKAFIVSKNPDLSRSDLMAFCRENLTSYKIPKRFDFRDDLPKSNVGKILRRKLRDEELATLK